MAHIMEIDTGIHLTHIVNGESTYRDGVFGWLMTCSCGNEFMAESVSLPMLHNPCPKCAPGETKKVLVVVESDDVDKPIIIHKDAR